jgi:hypothetical protein
MVVQGLVSTIDPIFNRSVFLPEAVIRMLRRTCRSIEMLIVDDGPTDETRHGALALAHAAEIRVIDQGTVTKGPRRFSLRFSDRVVGTSTSLYR